MREVFSFAASRIAVPLARLFCSIVMLRLSHALLRAPASHSAPRFLLRFPDSIAPCAPAMRLPCRMPRSPFR